jgi:bacterioferritin-associated ferredoxin
VIDAPLSALPAWDRLAAPDGQALKVGPLQRITFDELLIVDDDLPQLGAATLIWAWPVESGWAARAARIRGAAATPYAIRAARFRIERPDPNLLRLLGIDPAAPPSSVTIVGEPRPLEPMPRHLACICRLTSGERVYRAIHHGWRTVDELKRATEAGFGQCQGRRCLSGLAHRLDLTPDQPRGNMTPRPPLVPVPASVLAAFAEREA